MQIGNLTGSSFSSITCGNGETMMAYLRTGVILLLALMVAALPASVPADGIEILSHGKENTNGGQGATNQTPVNPKDITAAPVLGGKHVKPAVPASVNKVGRMVPAVAVTLSVDLTTHETNGIWRWNAMLQNIGAQPLPVNRLQLKVVQVIPLPHQTAPAGSSFPLPPLGPQQKRGFSSTWNRNQSARQLRLEVWDQQANTKVYEKLLALTTFADQVSAPLSPGLQKAMTIPGAREPSRIAITNGRYLGRGAWRLALANPSIQTVPAGDYAYTWVYKFSTGNDRSYTIPKDIPFAVPGNQSRTLLEAGAFYESNDCDCAGLDSVEVTLREKASGREEVYAIDVAIPNVDIEEFYIQMGQDPHFFSQAKVQTTLVNHSYYNLMLAYTLEVKMVKRTDQGVIRERFTRTGTIMLPARQTNQDAILVDDLREALPHLEIDDEFAYHPESDVSDDDYLPNRPAFFGSLTIAMPANAKCGPGRPLAYQQKALFIW
jgi:hypothetical protein